MKPHRAGVGGRILFDWSQVPFSEVSAMVTDFGQQMGHGDFSWPNGVTWREGAEAVGVPPG